MASVERSVVIEAPVEDVFAYMANPSHQPEIASDASRIEQVERLPQGGMRSQYVYEVAGMEFKGQIETIEYQPHSRMQFQLSGDVDGTLLWIFEALDEQTSRMVYIANYEVDIPLIGGAVAGVAAKLNEQEAETQLENVKRILESDGQ